MRNMYHIMCKGFLPELNKKHQSDCGIVSKRNPTELGTYSNCVKGVKETN